jgi:signal transduction histidine kinase
MAGLYLTNLKLFSRIWRPFFNTLSALKQFNFRERQRLELENSGIHEFDLLNRSLEGYTNKISQDFQSMKSFAENASHEMQTPLSVTQAKLDEAIQDENLSEDLSESLKSALKSISRLTRLNKSLLLLAKIENQQFPEREEIAVNDIIEKLLVDLEEMINLKKISLTIKMDEDLIVSANKELLRILLSNLFRNAIHHNYPRGKISINLSGQKFRISNTSESQITEPEKMFNRFYKGNQSGSSTGLGLAIVKSICDLYGWNPTFIVKNQLNILEVDVNFKIPSDW